MKKSSGFGQIWERHGSNRSTLHSIQFYFRRIHWPVTFKCMAEKKPQPTEPMNFGMDGEIPFFSSHLKQQFRPKWAHFLYNLRDVCFLEYISWPQTHKRCNFSANYHKQRANRYRHSISTTDGLFFGEKKSRALDLYLAKSLAPQDVSKKYATIQATTN